MKFEYDQMENFLIKTVNIFIIQEEIDVPSVKTTTSGSNSFIFHRICISLPELTLNKFLTVIKTYTSEKA